MIRPRAATFKPIRWDWWMGRVIREDILIRGERRGRRSVDTVHLERRPKITMKTLNTSNVKEIAKAVSQAVDMTHHRIVMIMSIVCCKKVRRRNGVNF